MREFSIGHYVAVAVPVLGMAFGIHYLIKHRPAPGTETADVLKPSQVKGDKKGSRKIASAMGEKNLDRRALKGGAESAEGAYAEAETGSEAAERDAAHEPSAKLAAAANDAAATGKDCAPVEYRGNGPEHTKVTKAEWAAVMDQFHDAKDQLAKWLHQNRAAIPEATYSMMERQVKNLKIQRPPSADEPDLAWRGIGVYTQGNDNEALIKIGGGFVKLANRHPARAKFEIARLVAQSWAPCELARASNAETSTAWAPLMKCLGLAEGQGCGQGTFSEAGWAVSTTVAASVSPPGCSIQAFNDPELAKCLKHVPFGSRTVASANGATGAAHEEHGAAHKESH
jgi:hypothetical protein